MNTQSSKIKFKFILIRLCLVVLGVTWLDLYAQPAPPTSVLKLESPKAKAAVAVIVLPPPRIITNVSLSWGYALPMPSQGIMFEVWTQTNAIPPKAYWEYKGGKWHLLATPWTLTTNWSLFATVNQSPYRFPNNKPHTLFIMRARDMNTGLVSDWAGK